MSEQAKTELSCGEYGRGGLWYPLRKWWQSSRLFNQDVGLPPFLEPGDPWWMNVDWLQRSLAASPWPGYIPAPLFVPYISESMHHPSQKISKEQYKWRVCLDVAHFSPSEISLSIKDGFLEVGGKHEERPDEHGFIARCFTRKYRLPAEIEATEVTSTLSVDGILTVEAPVPETSVPAVIIIPIKVEMEATEEQEEKHNEEQTPETDPETPEVQSAEDHEEEPPLEVHGDEAHPGIATVELQQHEVRRELEEETHEKPDGETHPSASADGKGTESLQSQESPDTDTPEQPEHKEPAAEGESQVVAGSEEGESQVVAGSVEGESQVVVGSAEGESQVVVGSAEGESQVVVGSAEGESQVVAGSGEGESQVEVGSAEAAEEITQPEEPELCQCPVSEVPSQQLEAPDIKQEHTE